MPTLLLGISGARGIVDDGLDETVVARLSEAFLEQIGPGPVILGRDSRHSGPRLAAAAQAVLEAAGRTVVDLGIVPTPTVQVAIESGAAAGGLIVTASHNPSHWNALKFVGPGGTFLAAEAMERLRARYMVLAEAPAAGGPRRARGSAAGDGRVPSGGVVTAAGAAAIEDQIARILAVVDRDAIRAARLRVVVDAVHGAGGVLIGPLLDRLGVEVSWIAGEPNGCLPEYPEPRAERLGPLAARVAEQGAALGFALDPDGDRCAPVLPGEVLGEEWTLPLCARARLAQGVRGPIVTNLSTASGIEHVAAHFGVPLIRTPVGEAHVVERMRALEACFGGEGNGGVIDPAVHYGRDAGVAIALLLALEAEGPGGRGGVAAAAQTLPPWTLIKEAVTLSADRLSALAERMSAQLGEPTSRADGWRWSWEARWLHVRPSNTEPIVRIVAEATEPAAAQELVAFVVAQVAGLEQDREGCGSTGKEASRDEGSDSDQAGTGGDRPL